MRLAILNSAPDMLALEKKINADPHRLSQFAEGSMAVLSGSFGGHGALTKDEAEICASLGISADQYRANKVGGASTAALTNTQRPAMSASYSGSLSADELAVCRSLGIDENAYLAAKADSAQAVLAAQNRHKTTGTLSADEVAICRSLGLSEAQFIATREARNA